MNNAWHIQIILILLPVLPQVLPESLPIPKLPCPVLFTIIHKIYWFHLIVNCRRPEQNPPEHEGLLSWRQLRSTYRKASCLPCICLKRHRFTKTKDIQSPSPTEDKGEPLNTFLVPYQTVEDAREIYFNKPYLSTFICLLFAFS